MLRILGSLIVILLLIGCAKDKPLYPKWFTQLHRDTEQTLYGVAEGSTKEEAVTHALNEIASKIRVSIKSTATTTTNIRVTNSEEEYNKDATQTVTNSVEKIEFSNYKIEKIEKLSENRFIVWVEVNKELNAKLLLNKIDTDIKKYAQLLKEEHKNPISTVKKYTQAIERIKNRNLLDCSIIKDFSPNSSVNNRVSKLLEIKEKMSKYQSNIIFSVNGDNKLYKDVLIKGISSKGFRTSNGQSTITISMSVKEKKLEVMGNKILKVKIGLTVKSDNKIIGQSRISVGAKSRTSYKQAREFTLRNFEKRLKTKIIEDLLGI